MLSFRLRRRPSREPIAAPMWAIGPSRPADPPTPRVRAVATVFRGATRSRIRPDRATIEAMIWGIPCPAASGANRWVMNHASHNPDGRTMKIQALEPSLPVARRASSPTKSTASMSTTAPRPAPSPTIAARTRSRGVVSILRWVILERSRAPSPLAGRRSSVDIGRCHPERLRTFED